MLLVDGVKYKLWIPPNEDEFERVVKEHAQEIFSEQSVYFDIKPRLTSELGTGSIPDGFVVFWGDSPNWRIVEVELSTHPLHDHIVSQIGRFISGIGNMTTQRKIVDVMDSELYKNEFIRLKLKKAIGSIEVYKFLSDLISKQPILTIIIEKETPALKEALKILNYPHIDVLEFQTFIREGVGLAVHAHLFEPIYETEPSPHLEISVETAEIKVWPAYIDYGYIGIWKKYRHLFPDIGTEIELITDEGDVFKTEVGDTSGSMELWDLKELYIKNPYLKKDDVFLITPIEPMRKYRIQIKRQ